MPLNSLEYCICTILCMPYSYLEWLQGFFIEHSTIGSTVHSMSLNSLKSCICTILCMPYSYLEWLQWFFMVHSTRGSAIHSIPLNSLEHCICAILCMPYSYLKWHQGFYIVHSTIGNTVHSMPFNNFEHCICTTTIINIRPDRESKLLPSGYKPQSIRMSQRAGPNVSYAAWYSTCWATCYTHMAANHNRPESMRKYSIHGISYLVSPFIRNWYALGIPCKYQLDQAEYSSVTSHQTQTIC